MKVKIQQEDLDNTLSKVKGAVNGNSTIDTIEGIKLSANNDKLLARATDLELDIQAESQADISKEGKIVVPGNDLCKLIKQLPKEEVTISLDSENKKVSIDTSDSSFSLPTYEVDEFPQPMDTEKSISLEIEAEQLTNIINKTVFSCANDNSQPSLNGILFDIKDDQLVTVSTNTYRLSCFRTELQIEIEDPEINLENEPFKVIVPQETMKEVGKLCKNVEENIKIDISDNNAVFIIGEDKITTRIIEGQFPNYEQVLPDEYNTEVEVNTSQLKNALKRVKIIADKESGILSINTYTERQLLEIESVTGEEGEAHEQIMCEMSGPNIDIRIDVNYLIDVVSKAVDNDITSMRLIGELNPLGIACEDYMHIIMPIRKD